MTRRDKGRPHRAWRKADLDRIAELAGKVPAREIRRELRLSKNQLDNARRLINASGGHVSLRCYRHRLELCPVVRVPQGDPRQGRHLRTVQTPAAA